MNTRAGVVAAIVVAIVIAAVVWMLWPTDAANGPHPLAPIDEPSGARDATTRPGSPQGAIRPRAFDATEESAPLPGPEAGLLVKVVNAAGEPVKGAVVASCDPNAPPAAFPTGVTRSDGSTRVRVDVPPAVAHLVVLGRGYPPALVGVDNATQQQVSLSGDALLVGRVVVNGNPPSSRLSLRIQGYSDPTQFWGAGIRVFLDRHGFGDTTIPFDTDENGDFTVRGPVKGETCVVVLPPGYRFVKTGPERGAREGIVRFDGRPVLLEIETRNVLTARVVAREAGAVRSQAFDVRYRLWGIAPGSGSDGVVEAELGRPFEIYFDDAVLNGVSMEIWRLPPPGARVGQKRFDQKITGSKDLGDVLLDDATTVTFVIKGPAGEPIADARVLAFGHVSPKTGGDGKTALAIYPGVHAVIVGAPRFRIEGFPLPEKLPPTMTVTLDHGCTLVVRVRNEDPGDPVRGLGVAIVYPVDAIAAAANSSSEFSDVRIGRPVRSDPPSLAGSAFDSANLYGGHPALQTQRYEVKAGEDLVVSGFKKADELRVRVEDLYGTVLLDEGTNFDEDDVKAMEMVVRSKPRTIRGTVLGDRSVALKGAIATVGVVEARTDAAGTFELRDVYTPEPSLGVSAHGHVTKSLLGPKVFDSPTIVLDRGRRLVVHLKGAWAADIGGPAVLQIEGHEPREARKRTIDTFVFDGVPCRPGVIKIPGHSSETTVPVGAEETLVEVTGPG